MEIEVFSLYKRFTNIFKLDVQGGSIYESYVADENTHFHRGKYYTHVKTPAKVEHVHPDVVTSLVRKAFTQKLIASGYTVDFETAFQSREDEIRNNAFSDIVQVFNGFRFRILGSSNRIYMICDPHLVIRSKASVGHILSLGVPIAILTGVKVSELSSSKTIGYIKEQNFQGGKIRIQKFDKPGPEDVEPNSISIEPRPEVIHNILSYAGRNVDFITLQRQKSLLDSKTASRDRFSQTLLTVDKLRKIFPLIFGDFTVNLAKDPLVVQV